jgi:hypothetical protein
MRTLFDLLLLAASDEGVLPLRPSRFTAHDLVHGVARRFSGRAVEAGGGPVRAHVRVDRAVGHGWCGTHDR